ncbi:hypothetical protein OsJ_00731 [Oryza sativa Japonica Group]|uniref:Uncharacterized protein n=1 Tax=Oryza sativa subsp. japonica TaxID=39947 RepID=B9ETM4_ORYSJ|nr:hypothetical protein OsJ_00731 [Oryza sativa Japonica Group]
MEAEEAAGGGERKRKRDGDAVRDDEEEEEEGVYEGIAEESVAELMRWLEMEISDAAPETETKTETESGDDPAGAAAPGVRHHQRQRGELRAVLSPPRRRRSWPPSTPAPARRPHRPSPGPSLRRRTWYRPRSSSTAWGRSGWSSY